MNSLDRLYLDCPICKVFMKPLGRNGSGSYSYRCPICKSKFLVNRDPKQQAWIAENACSDVRRAS